MAETDRDRSTGESGSLEVREGRLRYRSEVYGEWDLPVEAIRLIGEWTDEAGPFADDYFLVFAAGTGPWRSASFYAEGMLQALLDLEAPLGESLRTGLAGSTRLASRVIYPRELTGRPLLRFRLGRAGRAWRRVQQWFGRRRVGMVPTAEVRAFLRRADRTGP